VNVLVVVLADLLFLFLAPASQRLLQIALGIFATDHESDLAGRICGYSSVCIFDVRENLLAISFELCDQRQMKPLVFSYTRLSQ